MPFMLLAHTWCSSQLAMSRGVWDGPPDHRVHHLHSPDAITRNFGRGVDPANPWLLLGSSWLSLPWGTHRVWFCPSSQCYSSAQQELEKPLCLLEVESAEAPAEVGEVSLLRAELGSKVQCCDGAAGESLKPSSSHFCFLWCSER